MWVSIAACAAVVVTIVAGWAITPRLVAAQALLPVVAGIAVVTAAVAAFRRRRTGVAVAAAVALWAIGMVVPATTSHDRPSWSDSAQRVTVYSANLRRTNPSPDGAFAAAAARDADIVVFNEYVAAFEPALERSGLLDEYPTVIRDEQRDGNLLLTRLPMDESGVVSESGFELPTATVRVGSTSIFVAGVHTQAPTHFAYIDRWERQVPGVARAVDGHSNVIAIGDFNSSLWNPPMRRLLDWGFVDAHDATGNGLARTWGASPPGSDAAVPILGIDHAVSRGADVVPLSVDEGHVPGSDHRSIEVTYAVR